MNPRSGQTNQLPHAPGPARGPYFVKRELRRACAAWWPLLAETQSDVRGIVDFAQANEILAGAILRMANSPLSGLRQRVTRVDQAVALLGLNRLRSFVQETLRSAQDELHSERTS